MKVTAEFINSMKNSSMCVCVSALRRQSLASAHPAEGNRNRSLHETRTHFPTYI